MRRVTAPFGRVAVIGAGTTPLVGLLAADRFEVVAVDVSRAAIDALREQSAGADGVRYEVADARTLHLSEPVDTWHDRAVFHFLVDSADRDAYVASAKAAIGVGGHVVIATFAPCGPEQCSGLPVQRHDAASLSAAFGRGFELIDSFEADHETPSRTVQRFTHAVLRRVEN